jgi:hypothetical protein
VLERFGSDTARDAAVVEVGVSVRRREPDTFRPVLARVKDLRRRRSRCSLYSVGPSCGSASSFVIGLGSPLVPKDPGGIRLRRVVSPKDSRLDSPELGCVGLDSWEDAAHGDETRGGSGSKVNIDAIKNGRGRRGMRYGVKSRELCWG